jgi:hypothetical protein
VVTVEFIIGAVIVAVVAVLLLRYMKARSIVKVHSKTLSFRTGIPANQIESEIVNGNMTPGEWAASHGLDPMTFEPRGSGANRGHHESHKWSGSPPTGLDADGRPDGAAVGRLRDVADVPLASWTHCPVCTTELDEALQDVKVCMACLRAYTEGGVAPLARDDGGTGVIYDTEEYLPMILDHLGRAEYPKLVWMLRPSRDSSIPPILPDFELELRAFA